MRLDYSSHFPFKRPDQSPHVFSELNLINRNVATSSGASRIGGRWPRSLGIVVSPKLIFQIIEMLLPKHNELIEALRFDRFTIPLAAVLKS